MLATTPTILGTIPTILGTTPTILGTTPTILGTTPAMLGTTPTVLATTPAMLGTSPAVQATSPPLLAQGPVGPGEAYASGQSKNSHGDDQMKACSRLRLRVAPVGQLGKQPTAVVEHVALRGGDTPLALEHTQWRFKTEMVELWEQDQRRVGVLGGAGRGLG